MKKEIIMAGIVLFIQFTASMAQGNFSSLDDRMISQSYKFSYDNHTFSETIIFKEKDYNYYHGLSKERGGGVFKTEDRYEYYSKYTTDHASHPYLISLAEQLYSDAEKYGYTGYKLVEYLTAFVQKCFPYKLDPQKDIEYPRYPVETIIDGHGDCEDKAALLTALLTTFGFDAVLVNPTEHMAVGIYTEDYKKANFIYNNKGYLFIESTDTNIIIGVTPAQFENQNVEVIDAAPTTRFVPKISYADNSNDRKLYRLSNPTDQPDPVEYYQYRQIYVSDGNGGVIPANRKN